MAGNSEWRPADNTTPLASSSHPSYSSSNIQNRRSVSFSLPNPIKRMSGFIEKANQRPSPPQVSPPPSSPTAADDAVEEVEEVVSSPGAIDDPPAPNPIPPSASSIRQRKRSVVWNPSLVLENSGSVARDHLASERTFLAYVRTSLAIASTGVALVQLFTISVQSNSGNQLIATALSKQIQVFAKPLGSTAVCFGILVLLIGTTRYFTVQSALTQGKFPVARVVIAGMAFILACIVIIVFVILVSGKR
ncbi:hypothetical protein VKT23_006084 [Stygiomarasmius scandens]|uniref:DUF202 domain-containing protein n=1 Tax=Marasmiellus scandens TaxID=2682957 RepID=A0ABR1JP54_9AGAR